MPTGRPSGFIVIDSDGRIGRRTTAELRAQGLSFTKTLTVKTGRAGGGKHRYYAVPLDVDIRNDQGQKLGPGLDVKGKGGYVVYPSSTHPSGRRYRFELSQQTVAKAPQWIIDRLVRPLPIAANADDHAPRVIRVGQRTDTLLSLAGTMNKKGMCLSAIEAALLRENEERCDEALPEKKVRQIAKDIVTQYRQNNNALSSAEDDLQITRLCDELARPRVRVDWLWKWRLPRGTLSVLASKPKAGKSTFARNLALAVAQGEPFLGLDTTQGPVLYLCLEERKVDVTATFRRLGASQEEIHLAEYASMSQIAKAVERLRPVLVIVDTLFHLVGIRDENSYAEVTGKLSPLIDLARRTETHILCLHHSSKRPKAEAIDSPIGSTAISGAASTLLYMRQTEDDFRTLQTRQRIGRDLQEVFLEFDTRSKSIEMGRSRLDVEVATVAEQILNIVTETPQTEPEINQRVVGRNTYKRQALRDLVREGKLARTGSGKRNDQYLYTKP
jgi:hypothetical protein